MPTRRRVLAVAAALAAVGCARRPYVAHAGVTRIDYGPHRSQYIEVTLPAGTDPAPTVMILHGGYWGSGYGLELGAPLATDLAARGYAAVNVEYRRIGGDGGWPQTGDDVVAAFDALGGRDRLDLGRVVVLGHSAGGQLAGHLAAMRPLRGAVLQAGVLDLVAAHALGLGGGAVEQFLGGTPASRPDAYADASPAARVPWGVPSIAVHGVGDDVVPLSQSESFVAAARRAGDRAELRTVEGDHFAPITVGTPAWRACVDALAQLLG